MSIGTRLRAWGKERYKNMVNLSKKMNVSYASLQRYLNDERQLSAEQLIKLNQMGCDVHWLLTGRIAEAPEEIINNIAADLINERIPIYSGDEEEKGYQKVIKKLEEKIDYYERENEALKKKLSRINKISGGK